MEKINIRGLSREEWLVERRNGIGGSDAAAIMRLNPYKTPLDVYLDKVGEAPVDTGQSEAAYWGTVLEDPVARRFAELHEDVRVQRNNHILIHPEFGFARANIDREIHDATGEVYGLEIKTAGVASSKYWANEEVPAQYVIQCQHYLAITGWSKWIIAALIGGQTYVERTIPRDDEIIANLMTNEAAFWEKVQKRTPPEWDGSDTAWQVLREMYPHSLSGTTIDLPDSLANTLDMYAQASQTLKDLKAQTAALEKERDGYRQKIANAMGTAEKGFVPGYQITYKTIDVREKLVKAYSYRKMTIKKVEDEK